MFLRRETAPKELAAQARVSVELIKAVVRYFREPSMPAAISVKSRSTDCADAERAAHAALAALPRGGFREDWLFVAKSVAELSLQAGQAVAQAELYKAPNRREFLAAARFLSEAAAELAAALKSGGDENRLIEAKKLAISAGEVARRIRKAALSDARVVAGLKDQEIGKRLADAAEAAHAALDRLAGVCAKR